MHDLLRQDTLHPFAAALLPRAAVRPALRQSSAFLAGLLGGWAVLLVALIVVIVVAAIAASPFGIFISDEAADNDSIPISSIVAECNMELSNKLDDIENAAAADRSEIIG